MMHVRLISFFYRFVIYEKGIEDQVDILSPMEVGGLKSEEYLKMNPHGKVSHAVAVAASRLPATARTYSSGSFDRIQHETGVLVIRCIPITLLPFDAITVELCLIW